MFDKMKKITILIAAVILINTPAFGSENLEFSTGDCNNSTAAIDPYDKSTLGIKHADWVNAKTLQIKAYVSMICNEWIESGNFEIKDEKIVLKYVVGHSISKKFGYLPAQCMCVQELDYTIKNLQKRNYQFEMQGVATKNPKIVD
ncbi:MAG: hypothetical protein KKG91_06145 [Candidatus Omnitrophica bacterium]|nr:hypothetical protein [Candidatus Omnitrophota bacterium]